MNNINSFYKLLLNDKILLDENLLIRENLYINENSSVLETQSDDFNEKYISLNSEDYFINNNKVYYEKVLVNGNLFHDNNTDNKRSIDVLSFSENMPIGSFISNSLETVDNDFEFDKISTKSIFFKNNNLNFEEDTSNTITIKKYNNFGTLTDLYIECLDTTNTELNNNNLIYKNGSRYTFGLDESTPDVLRRSEDSDSNINIVREQSHYNLYFKEGYIREGIIGENILLFGDGKHNTIEYWESDTASNGIRFVNNDNIITIISNEIFETVSTVGGIQNGNY